MRYNSSILDRPFIALVILSIMGIRMEGVKHGCGKHFALILLVIQINALLNIYSIRRSTASHKIVFGLYFGDAVMNDFILKIMFHRT